MDYDFPAKRHYRRTVWSFADKCLGHISKRSRRVAYLDTSQGLETKFLIKSGYRPEHLHAINTNPAELAHITRKTKALGYRVNTHGQDAFSVIPDLIRDGNCDVINLDFCGPVNPKKYLLGIEAIGNAIEIKQSDMVFAVNFMRGREPDRLCRGIVPEEASDPWIELGATIREVANTSYWKSRIDRSFISGTGRLLTEEDRVRQAYIFTALPSNPASERCGIYRSTSGSLTFIFTMVHYANGRAIKASNQWKTQQHGTSNKVDTLGTYIHCLDFRSIERALNLET